MRRPNHEAVLDEAEASHKDVDRLGWGEVNDEVGVVDSEIRRDAVRNS